MRVAPNVRASPRRLSATMSNHSFIMRAAVALAASLFIAGPLPAQTATAESGASNPTVPFTVGEELVFHAKFGVIPAGTARMRVEGIDTVRGRAAYHVTFTVDGGVPFFRVHD